MKPNRLLLLAILAVATIVQPIHGQPRNALGGALHWRSIGPYRGGRVTGGCRVATPPLPFYKGAARGGALRNQGGRARPSQLSPRLFPHRAVGAPLPAPIEPPHTF